jgi:hypothetical protein
MSQPFLALSRRTVLGGIVILALALGAFLVWRHERDRIRAPEIEAYLDKSFGGGNVRFSDAHVETLGQDEAGVRIAVSAKAWSLRPLYVKIDAADYLQRTFQLDPNATAEARRLLADTSSALDPELRGAGPLPADPYRAVILQLKASPDTPFAFKGVVDAHRDNGAWAFVLVSGGFDGDAPQGAARPAFGEPSFLAGDAQDDGRLRSLAADLEAFAGRVAKNHQNAERAHADALDGRRGEFLAQIAPGRVFRGQAVEAGEQQGTHLYLEITDLSPGRGVTALLRNDGGWHFARPFQGTWSADAEFETLTLNLASLPDQAIRSGGPFLENAQTWKFALSVDRQGGLSERNQFFQYQFQAMDPDQALALRARLGEEFDGAFAATKPGLLYHGTASSVASGASEPILLRFTGRSEAGASLEAAVESTARPWKRALHGSITANSRRSGGAPIRLRTRSSEAIEDAPPDTVLGTADDLDLRFRVQDGSLVGNDGRFTYRLSIAEASDIHRLEADRAERARRFKEVFKDGIVYDGTVHEDQGFVTHARLEIARIDWESGSIAASVHSLVQLGIYRDFVGTCDPSSSSMALGALSRGSLDTSGDFGIPFLIAPAAITFNLTLSGDSVTGRIEGNPHWTFEFPVGAFLAAPMEGSDSKTPAPGRPELASFPKADGAYLLSHGAWVPLPRNNSHVVVETVREKSEPELPTNIVSAVAMGLGEIAKESDKKKISYLEFDGKESRPESSGPAVVLLVGPEPPGRPPVELAAAETVKDGLRRVEIADSSPTKIRFGEQRLAAYVRRVGPGFILLTTTSAPAAGIYAVNADGGYEFTQE